jgi:hypothetical protein
VITKGDRDHTLGAIGYLECHPSRSSGAEMRKIIRAPQVTGSGDRPRWSVWLTLETNLRLGIGEPERPVHPDGIGQRIGDDH